MINIPNWRSPRSNSVSPTRSRNFAPMNPKDVRLPVAVTRTLAVPLTTEVPRNTQDGRIRTCFGRGSPETGLFLHGHRFAGKRRLLHVEVAGLHKKSVCGNQVAGREPHQIARHDVLPPHFPPVSVAQDRGGRAHVLAQFPYGDFGPVGLDEIDRHAKHGDDKDDRRIGDLSDRDGNDDGHEQNDDERVEEQADQFGEERSALPGRWIVGSEFPETFLGLRLSETTRRTAQARKLRRHPCVVTSLSGHGVLTDACLPSP